MREAGDPHAFPPVMAELQEGGAVARALEPLPPARDRVDRGALQPRLRAARRDHRPQHDRPGSAQLLGSRHREHGDPQPVRHRGAEAAVAGAAARGRDPLLLPDDRARRRLLRRAATSHCRIERRRRRLRHQRAQVVVDRRGQPALQGRDRDGQDRPRRPALPPAEHGAGADGRARRDGRPRSARLRLQRAGEPLRSRARGRAGAESSILLERGRRLRDRPGPARAGAHPPLHALDRRRRAGPRTDVQAAEGAGRPSAGRWRSRA